MLEDYKKAVISDYHYKKEKGLLSLNLSHPTPAQLRDECLLVLNSRSQKKDEKIVKDFFNEGSDSNDYSHSIRKFDPDKLRPLTKYLKKQIEDTADRNIELLAWLIDFEPRPYRYGTDYSIRDNYGEEIKSSKPLPDSVKPTNDEGSQTESSTTKSNNGLILRKAIPALIILVLISGGIYYWRSSQVYICDHGTAKKYHLSNKCPALKNCKNSFVSTSITEAEKNGKTLCGFEIH